jgi:hypothetical protein
VLYSPSAWMRCCLLDMQKECRSCTTCLRQGWGTPVVMMMNVSYEGWVVPLGAGRGGGELVVHGRGGGGSRNFVKWVGDWVGYLISCFLLEL